MNQHHYNLEDLTAWAVDKLRQLGREDIHEVMGDNPDNLRRFSKLVLAVDAGQPVQADDEVFLGELCQRLGEIFFTDVWDELAA